MRLLAFAHVAHLETQMATFIGRRTHRDDWLELIDDHGKRTIGMAKKLARDRLDPNLIELTMFSEKRQIVGRLLELSEAETAELTAIEHMRNDVAHGTDYGRTNEQLHRFVRAVARVEAWIRRLEISRDGRAVTASLETRGR